MQQESMEKTTTDYRIEQMLRGGFNIGSIAKVVGLSETDITHFRAKLMDKTMVKKPSVAGTKEQILSQIRAITKLRLEDGAKLKKDTLIELAEALCKKKY